MFLHWASIVRALVLFVLGAVVQSQWTAWRSGKAEQVGKTAEERKRNQSRQYPARARPEPSTVTAHDLNIWSSFAACHYPKHREKTQRPTKMKNQEKGMETPERWESYAASHYKNKSQTMCQDGTHSRGLRRESSLFFERTMSSDAAVTQDTSTFVRTRRNSAKPSRRDEAPTDVGRARLQQSGCATSLLSLSSPKRERRIPVKPAKHVGKSSGTRFYADVVAKSRAEVQGIRRSVSF